jgi:hypothetical protein
MLRFSGGPGNIPHTFRNIGDTPGQLSLNVIPGRFAATVKQLVHEYNVEILT